MAANSKIEWTDHTQNFWVGCTKISPACEFCYAETWAKRFGHPELWQGERRRTTESNWQKPLQWDRAAAANRAKVFTNSLADFFDNQVPTRWRDDAWHLIEQTPNLDWLILTKRPQNICKMLPTPAIGCKPWGEGWSNVWLGITCCNQTEFDRDWPVLRDVPAAIRFISYEPALGRLHACEALGVWLRQHEDKSLTWERAEIDYPRPDWFICGGESGPNARPMHPDWARSLRDQCVAASVPFFYKQTGEWSPDPPPSDDKYPGLRCDVTHHSIKGVAGYGSTMFKVGKKVAGRLLDGKEWNQFPTIKQRQQPASAPVLFGINP